MQAERPAPVSSAVPRQVKNMKTPTTKQSVSVASIFTNAPHKARAYEKPSAFKGAVKFTESRRTSLSKPVTKTGKGSSGSLAKKAASRQTESHPLSIDFMKATNGVRKYNREKNTTRLNETYNTLINQLHNLNVQPVSSSGDPSDSPLKLSLAGQIQRESIGLGESLGNTVLRDKPIREDDPGSKLSTRFAQFEARVKNSTKKIEELQYEWALTVGKIWQLGCQLLGEEVMRDMLLPRGFGVAPPDSPSVNQVVDQADDTSDELSHGPERQHKSKKRVKFGDPLPDFFTKPSLMPVKALPKVPGVAVEELKKRLTELGITQIEELKKMEKEHQQWFSAKQKKIAQALRD